MSIEIEEKTELGVTADLLSSVPDDYQKNAGYFIWDFCRVLGIVFVKFWEKLRYLTNFYNIENLDYDDLVRFVLERAGIVAHTETHSSGELTVISGTSVYEGAIFETSSGLQFQSLETKNLTVGSKLTAQCVTAGSVGNVPANTITTSVSIEGLSVTNEEAFTGGYDKEAKSSIIERYLFKIKNPISSGNKYHYMYWAKEISGVGNVKVKPLWNGNNTVKVIIVDSNNEPASSEIVDAVQEYIDPYEEIEGIKVGWGCGNGEAPIGAYCTVESAQTLNIDVSVNVLLMAGADENEVEENITKAIEEYVKSTVFKKDYVSYSAIGSAIYNTEGVFDYGNLTVNGSTNNVIVADTDVYCECPKLNSVTIQFVTQ